MAQTGKKWYVLRAVSGKEGKVKEYLEALMKKDELLAANVGEILLPTEKYAQLRNGKRVVKEKLFLPGYVLVEANLQGEVAHTLRFMPNVLGFLGGLGYRRTVQRIQWHHRGGERREAQAEGDGEDLRSQDPAGTVVQSGGKGIGHKLRYVRFLYTVRGRLPLPGTYIKFN